MMKSLIKHSGSNKKERDEKRKKKEEIFKGEKSIFHVLR